VSKSNLPKIANYQAKIAAPFAVLGVRTEKDWLVGIDYLSINTPLLAPLNPFAREVCKQLRSYLIEPNFVFDLSLYIDGTAHQRRVWQAIQVIRSGETSSYAEIATQVHSAPRAVGGACGANKLPIVIPCHRVIAKNGELGGFMNASKGHPLEIKRWLLRHEYT